MRPRHVALARAVAGQVAIETASGGQDLAEPGEIGDRPLLPLIDEKLSTLAKLSDGMLETAAAVSAVAGIATGRRRAGSAS